MATTRDTRGFFAARKYRKVLDLLHQDEASRKGIQGSQRLFASPG